MSLKDTLSTYWIRIQEELLPWLDDTTLGPLSGHHKQLVNVLGMVRIEAFLPGWQGLPGRPPSERAALARAFVAKAVFNVPTTRLLIEILSADKTLRRLCGDCLKIGGVGSHRSLSEEKGEEFGHSQGRHRPRKPASPPILRQSPRRTAMARSRRCAPPGTTCYSRSRARPPASRSDRVPPTWCRSDVILPLSLLAARPLAPNARLALAVLHAFKLQAIGISEEHGIVVVVVLPRRIDDGRA